MDTGDTACTKHHVVVVPDTALYNAQMNTTNVVTGGYVGSAMYKSNLTQAKNTITSAFGAAHLLTIRKFFTTATDPSWGFATSSEWQDATVWLMNELCLYGCYVHTDMYHDYTKWTASKYTEDNTQYPLFSMNPNMIRRSRYSFWLRDVVSVAVFAVVSGYGDASYYSASYSLGVRPAFLVI